MTTITCDVAELLPPGEELLPVFTGVPMTLPPPTHEVKMRRNVTAITAGHTFSHGFGLPCIGTPPNAQQCPPAPACREFRQNLVVYRIKKVACLNRKNLDTS